jgi:TetR/AcrR family transcriptional regulator, cholesterol catabolism regulator
MRRRQIAEVTLDLIAENGVAGTSAVAIAAAAGVSEAAFYHHFGNRKNVLRAALDLAFEGILRTWTVPAQENAIDLLRRLDKDHSLAIAARGRDFAARFQFIVAPATCGMTLEVKKRELVVISAIASVIDKGKREGLFREEVDSYNTAWKLTAIFWLKDVSHLIDLENVVLAGPSGELLEDVIASIVTDSARGALRTAERGPAPFSQL